MATIDVVVGRQPIFDADLAVVGYELLPGGPTPSGGRDGTPGGGAGSGTRALLYDAVAIGLSRLVGELTVCVDVDRTVLDEGLPVQFPPERTVLEIGFQPALDEALLDGCAALVESGYKLALDHVSSPVLDGRLAKLASVVKVERELLAAGGLEGVLGRFGDPPPVVVALGVGSFEDLERAREIGCDFFQGDLLSRPQSVPGRTLDSSGGARLQLALRLASSESSAAELEQVIRGEPAMVYQLLQMASVGAYHGMRREVRSLREALVLLGWQRIQSWLSFLIVTSRGQTSEEELVTTLTRARMCELVALQCCPRASDLAFTAGMVSAFDILLDMRIEDVLATLPVDEELRRAVLGEDTPVGRIVADVVDCQHGHSGTAGRSGMSEVALHGASIEALSWALEVARLSDDGVRRAALPLVPRGVQAVAGTG